jgi:hypothetical protein
LGHFQGFTLRLIGVSTKASAQALRVNRPRRLDVEDITFFREADAPTRRRRRLIMARELDFYQRLWAERAAEERAAVRAYFTVYRWVEWQVFLPDDFTVTKMVEAGLALKRLYHRSMKPLRKRRCQRVLKVGD